MNIIGVELVQPRLLSKAIWLFRP